MPREISFGSGRAQKLRRGLERLKEGRIEEAVRELEPLARRGDPLGRSARRHLAGACRQAGLAALRAGQLPQAEAHLRRAAAILGPQCDVQDALADICARTGRFDRCEEELQRALALRASDPSAWRKLAQAQWRGGRRAAAHMTLEAAVRRVGPVAELFLQQGLFFCAEDRIAEARAAFARAAEADSDCAEAHYYLGLSAAAAGNHRLAVEGLQHAAELPCGPSGRQQQRLAMYHLALAARAARQSGAGVPVRISRLPPAPRNDGQTDLPTELIEATLKSFEGPGGVDLAADDRRRLESLLGAVRSALRRSPGQAELHGYCADALELLGRPGEALLHARQAAGAPDYHAPAAPGADTTRPVPLVRLGRLCARLGLREEAVGRLEAAVACGADWADVHALLAELLTALGRLTEARSHLARALELNPQLRLAEGLRARLAA